MNWQAFLDPAFSGRLCLTLLHSLWQVALLATAARGLELCWGRRRLERSYAAYVAALLAGLAAGPITYMLVDVGPAAELRRQIAEERRPAPGFDGRESAVENHSPVPARDARRSTPAALPTAVADPVAPEPGRTSAEEFSPGWLWVAPWLAAFYAAGVLVMLVRLAIGIWRAHRFAARADLLRDGPLVDLLRTLAGKWSMRVVPALACAERIVVPRLVGLVRPLILLPSSAITGLSPGELEMVLAHELAHVRRHDMWVNLLERVAEAVLFFNPALWYLTRRLSLLREFCCDELTCRAMAQSGADPRTRYARALLRVAELSYAHDAAFDGSRVAALAASGRSPSELRRRIARLLGEPLREPVCVSRGGLIMVAVLAALLLIGPPTWRSAADSAHSAEAAADEKDKPKADTREKDAAAGGLGVHGRVLDASTGEPIANVRLIAGSPYNELHTTWQSHLVTQHAGGKYEWHADRPWERTRLRVEANGYRPAVTRIIKQDEGVVAIDFRLERDDGLRGVVQDAEGRLVKGAQVALTTQTFETVVANGTLRYAHGERLGAKVVVTDDQGRFQLPPEVDPLLIVATHAESGFAVLSQSELVPGSVILTLKPWCRVEGRLLADEKPEVNENVSIGAGWQPTPQWPVLSHSNDAKTDDDGRFICERVAAGSHFLQQRQPHGDGSFALYPSRSLMAKAGETMRVTVGAQRRTVVGKLESSVAAALPKDFDWSLVTISVSLRLSPPWKEGGPQLGSYSRYVQSDEAKQAHRTGIAVQRDGSFRIEGLPPASYRLEVTPVKADNAVARWTFGSSHSYDVPLVDDSKQAEPHNLGAVELAVAPPGNSNAETTDREYTFPITVFGRAVNEAGNAIADAEIYLAARRPGYRRLAETKTAADGSYRFDKILLPIERADTNAGRNSGSFEVFGVAEGHALAWRPTKSFYPDRKHDLVHPVDPKQEPTSSYGTEDPIELDLTFGPPNTIRGRVVDDQGQPLAKAALAIRYCDTQWDQPDYSTSRFLGSLDSLNAQSIVPPRIKTRLTDADGRFEFTALPSDYRWSIDVHPPNHPPRKIWAVTREGIVADATGNRIYSGDFELVFPRPRTVKLRVVYDDTGAPAPKVGVGGIVTKTGFWETTDAAGVIETPLPDGRHQIHLVPRYGSTYLRTEAEISVSAETVTGTATLRLRPAAVVDITVVDAVTRQPLAGVDVGLNGSVHGYRSWEVETRISHYERPRSDKNGKMRVLFEPGKHDISIGLEAYPAGYVPIDVGGKEIDCQLGKPIAVELTMLNTNPPQTSADNSTGPTREPAPAEPTRAANATETNQRSELSIIVARQVLLLEGKQIVTWADLEKKIAAMPDPSLVYPYYYITRGASETEAYKLAKNEIWRLRSQFKFKGHSEGSLSARSDVRYDRIEKPADLVPDEKLRVEGKVLDQEGKAVAGAEVILATPVDESISYKSYDMAIAEGRIHNRLDHLMTESDAAGQFVLYPPKDGNFYVVALHPASGFHVAASKQFTAKPEIRLIPWARLAVEIDEEAGLRQSVTLRTRVPAIPEVIVSQEPQDLKSKPSTRSFEFSHVPAIWDSTISRTFPDAQGVSIGLPGASVQLLAGETRRINLGALTQQQRELLEERRQDVRRRGADEKPADAAPPKAPPAAARVDTGSDLLRGLRKASAPLLAEMVEKHGYGLTPDQILRRVAPPFAPIRMTYYRVGSPTQAAAIPRGPSAMTFHFKDKELTNWGMTFGQEDDQGYTLTGVLDALQEIKTQQIEGPSDLLSTRLPGDWVIRPGQGDEVVVRQLEKILREELKLPVHLEFREVQREVYVARGRYRLTPLPEQPAEEKLHLTDETIITDPVQVFAHRLVPNSGAGGGTGDFSEFLNWLGRWIETPIVDEATERPKRQISWRLHERSPSTARTRQEDHDAERVLQNIAAQTSLSFGKETRAVKILFVEKQE